MLSDLVWESKNASFEVKVLKGRILRFAEFSVRECAILPIFSVHTLCFMFYLFFKIFSLILRLKIPGILIHTYLWCTYSRKNNKSMKQIDVLKMKHYLIIIGNYFPKLVLLPFPLYAVHRYRNSGRHAEIYLMKWSWRSCVVLVLNTLNKYSTTIVTSMYVALTHI